MLSVCFVSIKIFFLCAVGVVSIAVHATCPQPAKVYLRSPTRDAAGAEGIGRYLPYAGGAAALVALAVTFNLAGKGPDIVFDGAETLSYYLVQFSK